MLSGRNQQTYRQRNCFLKREAVMEDVKREVLGAVRGAKPFRVLMSLMCVSPVWTMLRQSQNLFTVVWRRSVSECRMNFDQQGC